LLDFVEEKVLLAYLHDFIIVLVALGYYYEGIRLI
jgi:hypothetical protein